MGASQRNKGAAGERELAKLLSESLGFDCHRNLEQSRCGGADLLGVGPWAIEVKRHERLQIPKWWGQACQQAKDLYPALAYRQSRQPWTVLVPLALLIGEQQDWVNGYRAALSLEGFCHLTKKLLEDDDDRAAVDPMGRVHANGARFRAGVPEAHGIASVHG